MTVTAAEFDELVSLLRGFIRREVMPAEAGIDESDEIPARLIEQAKEMGLYGYALPVEYGGLGLSVEQQVRVAIELGYTSPAFRSLFGTNNGIAGQVLVSAGTDAAAQAVAAPAGLRRGGRLLRADRAGGRI
jgi:acyl-CoA dehydrogenase